MPRERQFALTAAPAAHEADVLAQVVRMLADVLRIKQEKIDPEQTFRTCGVDSLLSVEYVATVNVHYGTAIKPAALIDHPTPVDFARYVARETAPLGAMPAAAPPVAAPMPHAMEPAPQCPVSVPAPPVLDVLREEIARILCCDPWDIDTAESFTALGVDTELAAEFVSVVNLVYGLRERPGVLYDHPDLTALAAHIAAQLPVGPDPVAVAQAMAGGPMPLEELLDAVRDGRVTVDQAMTLLPRQD
ncbi:acyl carrier protein [Streptomyces sp. SID14478]|uniref:acyl carrier protein n=1 Tax=Streptomyces sp. SID14478 TaxID=2706073 RepID=UPI0013DCE42A|nr:acyl carrier protein [Streptomyces sp. SID14478]NEB77929.1 acyl carrier protein [Streptomyces sp. SID14478]